MMKIIKKIGYGLSALALMAFCAVGIVNGVTYAAGSNPQETICDGVGKVLDGSCAEDEITMDNIWNTAADVVNWILIAVGIICVVFIIFGGIRYATSGGDAEKVKKAKNTLLYAIIGLAIALLAAVIVNLVVDLTAGF